MARRCSLIVRSSGSSCARRTADSRNRACAGSDAVGRGRARLARSKIRNLSLEALAASAHHTQSSSMNGLAARPSANTASM